VLHDLQMALLADQILVLRVGGVPHAGASDAPATHAALVQAFDDRIRIVPLDGRCAVFPV
jgi:iron complex transport system ATP-binding protein